jgi:hypothetical protein
MYNRTLTSLVLTIRDINQYVQDLNDIVVNQSVILL